MFVEFFKTLFILPTLAPAYQPCANEVYVIKNSTIVPNSTACDFVAIRCGQEQAKVIERGLFKNFNGPNVKHLRLRSCGEVESIEKGAFDDLPNLEDLRVLNTNISIVNLFSFGKMLKLKKLMLSNSRKPGRAQVPSSLTIDIDNYYPNLTHLIINKVGARKFSTANWQKLVPQLTLLNLEGNAISGGAQNFIEALPSSVEKLYLGDNSISYLKISGLHNLTNLSLRINNFTSLRFTDVPDNCEPKTQLCLGPMNNLKSLNLRYGQISEFTIDYEDRDALPKLAELDLSVNNLKTVSDVSSMPKMLVKFKSLRRLQISLRCLDTVTTLCVFSSLKNLDVSGVKTDFLPLALRKDTCMPNVTIENDGILDYYVKDLLSCETSY